MPGVATIAMDSFSRDRRPSLGELEQQHTFGTKETYLHAEQRLHAPKTGLVSVT